MLRRFRNRFLEENLTKKKSEQLDRDIQLMQNRMRAKCDEIRSGRSRLLHDESMTLKR